jgi:hypothetical protein
LKRGALIQNADQRAEVSSQTQAYFDSSWLLPDFEQVKMNGQGATTMKSIKLVGTLMKRSRQKWLASGSAYLGFMRLDSTLTLGTGSVGQRRCAVSLMRTATTRTTAGSPDNRHHERETINIPALEFGPDEGAGCVCSGNVAPANRWSDV